MVTSIEYALIAGLAAVALVGAGVPLGKSLTATFQEISAALEPANTCTGAFCIEPAAGERDGTGRRNR